MAGTCIKIGDTNIKKLDTSGLATGLVKIQLRKFLVTQALMRDSANGVLFANLQGRRYRVIGLEKDGACILDAD